MQLSGSIVLSRLQVDSDEYQIISSAEDLVRFHVSNSQGEAYEASPKQLRIEVYKNGEEDPLNFQNYYRFYCIDRSQDLQKFLNFGEITGGDNEIGDENVNEVVINPNTLYFDIDRLLKSSEGRDFLEDDLVFVFEYVQDNIVLAAKAFQLRNGISSEMAKFNLTATAINASVDNTKLSFTENGLEIKNGGITIKDDSDSIVLGFETKTINGEEISKLAVRGAIYADEGHFTGSIHATDASFDSGEIGGFKISQGELSSIGTDEEGQPKIKLNGNLGKIIANDIELGSNATVADYIQLGQNTFLYNSDLPKHEKKVLECGDIVIRNNGKANFGKIQVSGPDSEIKGLNWYIGDEYASFSNVNVSGAIETSVFKNNCVQAVGGSLIFRPSYKGKMSLQDDKYTAVLEEEFGGVVGCYVQIVYNNAYNIHYGTVKEIREIEKEQEGQKYTEVDIEFKKVGWAQRDLFEGMDIILIDYGKDDYGKVVYSYPIATETYYQLIEEGEEKEYAEVNIDELYSYITTNNDFMRSDNFKIYDVDAFSSFLTTETSALTEDRDLLRNGIQNYYVQMKTALIGMNSGDSATGIDGKFLPRGLTLTTLNNNPSEPNLYLGDLKMIGKSGYGLYADNVFLRGALTTNLQENLYAGMNTVSDITATAFDKNFEPPKTPTVSDDSKIILWAGARGLEDEEIQHAYFQVTAGGSVYAQRMKLVDTLLVGGSITGTNIYAANLIGKERGALNIYDAAAGKGIVFRKDFENTQSEIFSIGSDGFIAKDKTFIKVSSNSDEVSFTGNTFQTHNKNTYLCLTTLAESGGKTTPALIHTQSSDKCGLYFEKNSTSFKITSTTSQGSTLQTAQTWKPNENILYNKVTFSGEEIVMEYREVENGRDLYIS